MCALSEWMCLSVVRRLCVPVTKAVRMQRTRKFPGARPNTREHPPTTARARLRTLRMYHAYKHANRDVYCRINTLLQQTLKLFYEDALYYYTITLVLDLFNKLITRLVRCTCIRNAWCSYILNTIPTTPLLILL